MFGYPDIHNDEVVKIMKDVAKKATAAGKILGSTFVNPSHCEKWIKSGYRFMNISDPLSIGTSNLAKEIARLRNI